MISSEARALTEWKQDDPRRFALYFGLFEALLKGSMCWPRQAAIDLKQTVEASNWIVGPLSGPGVKMHTTNVIASMALIARIGFNGDYIRTVTRGRRAQYGHERL